MTDLFELGSVAVLGGCAALAVAALAYARPRSALVTSYLLLAVAGIKFRLRSPTDSLTGQIDWQIGLELILYASVALIVVMSAVSGQTPRRRLAPAEFLLVLFAGLALASTFWSTAPSLTVVRALQMVIVCGLALVSVRLLGPAETLRGVSAVLVTYVICCAAFGTVFGMVEVDPTIREEVAFRLSWFAVHPITAGSLAAVALLLALGRSLFAQHRQPTRLRMLLRWIVPLSLASILVLTNSRGPLLAFMVAAGVVVWKTMRAGLARGILATAVIFVAIVALFSESSTLTKDAQGGDNFVAQRILRGSDVDRLRGLNGRVEVWEAALPLIAEQPLFGYGYHGSRAILFEKVPWASYAHSAYVQSLLDFGFLGALLVWGVFGWASLTLVSRRFGAVTGTAWCDASLTGLAAYLLVVSVSSESFIATPGYEALLMFILVSVVAQREASLLQGFQRPIGYHTFWPSVARRSRWLPAASRSGL